MTLTILISACTATRARPEAPEESRHLGLMNDYSKLQIHRRYPAALVYVKPNVQWRKYSANQLESAGLYGTDKTEVLSPEDQGRPAASQGAARGSELLG